MKSASSIGQSIRPLQICGAWLNHIYTYNEQCILSIPALRLTSCIPQYLERPGVIPHRLRPALSMGFS
jgi:hypothetical protein